MAISDFSALFFLPNRMVSECERDIPPLYSTEPKVWSVRILDHALAPPMASKWRSRTLATVVPAGASVRGV